MRAETDQGLVRIGKETSLEHLDLQGANISDQGLANLVELVRLLTLNLTLTPIGDAGIANIAGLSALELVDLTSTYITDEAMGFVAMWEGLRVLSIVNTRIHNRGLGRLRHLRHIAVIDARHTFVDREGVEAIHLERRRLNLPPVRIYWGGRVDFEREEATPPTPQPATPKPGPDNFSTLSFVVQPTDVPSTILGTIVVRDFLGVYPQVGAVVTLYTDAGAIGTATTDASGNATFTGLTVGSAGTYTLFATSPNQTPATSNSFTVGSILSFLTQPMNGTYNVLATVVVSDKLPDSTPVVGEEVYIALESGSGTLGGMTTATTDSSGNATFTDLTLAPSGTYTLIATASMQTSAISTAFVLTLPWSLSFVTEPIQGSDHGLDLNTPVVRVSPTYNGLPITLTAPNPAGGTWGETVTANSSGLASFTGLSAPAFGTYTFTASSGLTPSITSDPFTLVRCYLSFGPQPENCLAGSLFGCGVWILGGADNQDITISSDPAGVAGTLMEFVVSPEGDWTDLHIATPGTYTLTATGLSGYTVAVSNSFIVVASFVFTEVPSGTLSTPLFGNIVTSGASPGGVVSLTINGAPAGSATSDASGNATWYGLYAGNGTYSLVATWGTYTATASFIVDIVPGTCYISYDGVGDSPLTPDNFPNLLQVELTDQAGYTGTYMLSPVDPSYAPSCRFLWTVALGGGYSLQGLFFGGSGARIQISLDAGSSSVWASSGSVSAGSNVCNPLSGAATGTAVVNLSYSQG